MALGGGKDYTAGDHRALADNLLSMAGNRIELQQMANINKKIAEERFLRKTAYTSILVLISRLLCES